MVEWDIEKGRRRTGGGRTGDFCWVILGHEMKMCKVYLEVKGPQQMTILLCSGYLAWSKKDQQQYINVSLNSYVPSLTFVRTYYRLVYS